MNYEFLGTPGSWKIYRVFEKPLTSVDEGKTWSHLDHWIMHENTNAMIGAVKYQSEGAGYPSVTHLPEMEANAYLISAAPELLQACIGAHKKLSEVLNLDLSERAYIRIWDEFKTVEAAIHKALNIQP